MNEQRPAFSADHCKVDLAHKQESPVFFNPVDDIQVMLVEMQALNSRIIKAVQERTPSPKVENKEDLLTSLNQMLIFVNNDYASDLLTVIDIIEQLEEM